MSAALVCAVAVRAPAAGAVSFQVMEGLNVNAFVAEGPTAAHVVLRSGLDPRLLVAFPAGNSGVAIWFDTVGQPVRWTLQGPATPVDGSDLHGRALHGITARASIAAASLTMKQVLLSNVRVLRDYQRYGTFPADVAAAPSLDGRSVTWARDRLDGAPGYVLRLDMTDGSYRDGRLVAGEDGMIAFTLTALTGEAPLTPFADGTLLTDSAVDDPAARRTLSFLSYDEKFLAGSWRFDTYFGRDTLMSMRLLMPVLTASAVEAGLRSVLARLSDQGEVAHEEDVGELAILDHVRANGTRSDAPVYDYRMIDADYMLPLVASAWLLDDPRGRNGAAAMLARPDGRYGRAPQAAGADLVANLRFVLRSAAPFAAVPDASRLISLKPGQLAGEWRDSDIGLGHGRYPYDVNAVFVPAALEAADRLLASGLLDPYLAQADRDDLSKAAALAAVWKAHARPFFEVTVPNGAARDMVRGYATFLGVDSPDAALGDTPVRLLALALDAEGRPIPVMHSDIGFDLLFGHPDAAQLDDILSAITQPFPAGLLTDAGVVVANPVFASASLRSELDKHAYHGTVVWSWQHAVLAAGLDRQIARGDLPDATVARMKSARAMLWKAIDTAQAVGNSELWSWSYVDHRFRIAAFGASGMDADESNAAQLWSTVFLALHRPAS